MTFQIEKIETKSSRVRTPTCLKMSQAHFNNPMKHSKGDQLLLGLHAEPSSAFVNTHLGPIGTDQLGITLVHEHVFNKYPFFRKSRSDTFILQELQRLKGYSVGTVIDLTPYTHLANYKEVIKFTGLKIVCCTGFYTHRHVPVALRRATVQQLKLHLSKHIVSGRGITQIKPGIIKVAGQHQEMSDLERRVFQAAALAQREHSVPIATHSPHGATAHLKCLKSAGASIQNVFFSHLDKGLSVSNSQFECRLNEAQKILDHGGRLVFSEFGTGKNPQRATPALKLITFLKERGYLNQLLISADSNWRWRGGNPALRDHAYHGVPRNYSYVFTVIIPTLRSASFSECELRTMLIDNPRALFEFA